MLFSYHGHGILWPTHNFHEAPTFQNLPGYQALRNTRISLVSCPYVCISQVLNFYFMRIKLKLISKSIFNLLNNYNYNFYYSLQFFLYYI